MEEFVAALRRRQDELGLGTNAFAQEIGVEPSQWIRVAAGKWRPGLRFVMRSLGAFPDLLPFFLVDLRKFSTRGVDHTLQKGDGGASCSA